MLLHSFEPPVQRRIERILLVVPHRWRSGSAACTTVRRTGRRRGPGRCWSTLACRRRSPLASSTVRCPPSLLLLRSFSQLLSRQAEPSVDVLSGHPGIGGVLDWSRCDRADKLVSLLAELPPPRDPEAEAQEDADALSGVMTGRDQLRADDYIRPYIDETDSDVED